MMAELMALHGLDEQAVIERLAREQAAAELQFAIERLDVLGYAGSWYDTDSGSLHVALTDDAAAAQLERLGGVVVPVSHGIDELSALADDMTASLAQEPALSNAIAGHSVNIPENRVDVFILAPLADAARSRIYTEGARPELIQIVPIDSFPVVSSGDVRGADGTRNFTWQQQTGQIWPCSIGVSIVGGYVTAGHCGSPGNIMHTPSGQFLGTFQATQWGSGGDGGWVDTASGWIPRPKINGYADGILSVPAKWAGLLEAPIGATVCRYGQTSAFPDCGSIVAKDVTVDFQLDVFTRVTVNGLTETNGICTDDGDSGGPYITPPGQVQGTNTGGQPGNTCPVPANRTWFQPIGDTLTAYSKTMRTVHGSAPPGVNGVLCPNPADSGAGLYVCNLSDFDSQGQTEIDWTGSGGHTSTSNWLFGSCSVGTWVSVDLEVQNPYGTYADHWVFPCPSGPLP
ncbi:MAG: S1 family peptidase [Candidatus Wenzhouxiangella sp. M2_3B_020]